MNDIKWQHPPEHLPEPPVPLAPIPEHPDNPEQPLIIPATEPKKDNDEKDPGD